MNGKFYISLIFICVCLSQPVSALADAPLDDELSKAMELPPNSDRGKAIYLELCSQCHGEDGWGTYGGDYPQLAGQHRSVVIKQLADIRAGNRDNPRMYPIARESVMGGPQAISDVAAYITTLPMDPEPEVGDGEHLETAENLYEKFCSHCHGPNGGGNEELFYPLIRGQHYEYLLRQLLWIRDGKRRNADKNMAKVIQQLGNEELTLLADYVSRLVPDK